MTCWCAWWQWLLERIMHWLVPDAEMTAQAIDLAARSAGNRVPS